MSTTPDKETFVECIIAATVRDGVVRLDFGEFVEPQQGKDKPSGAQQQMLAKHRLVMPVAGFARSMQVLQEVFKRIEETQPAGTSPPKIVTAEPPTRQ